MARSITFHGAAQTVTGSRHLLTLGKKKILIDCGLFQGRREIRARNWEPFPVDVTSLDAIVLTHAHTDHAGFLPRVVRQGYSGPVYATPGTISIAKVSLPDGGRIQEEDARYHNRHRTSRHEPAEPLFTEADAMRALKLLKPVRYHVPQKLPGGASVRLLPAGHILGAAIAEITLPDGKLLVMSGDVGRYDRPIIKDPSPVYTADYLVMESTYGNRLHSDREAKPVLERLFIEAVQNKSVVLVPSFAIGRTQELLWDIHELTEEGRIPKIPIYVDSPMATAATLLYATHKEDHDKEMKVRLAKGETPLKPDLVRFVRDRAMSKSLNKEKGPMVIIAGSGMLSGGRIVHHLRIRLPDPSTVLLFTGYQAEGTRGRDLIEGAKQIRLFGHNVEVNARIERLDSLSAHADYSELLRWLESIQEPPRTTYLVHGELRVQKELKRRIEEKFGWPVEIPGHGQSFELD
ncbi:MAG: MBL fold metallo-hydrolase [Armatimonadetes bacterium]|nr:MBL fold metallo-hydrolase [Armatimonadota bacterium]